MQLSNTNMFLVVSGLLLLSTLYIIYQNNNNSRMFGELVKNVKDLNSNTRNYLDGVKYDLANTSDKLNKQVSNVEQLYLNTRIGTPEEVDRKLKGQYEQYNIPSELIENENVDVDPESDNMDNNFFDEDNFNREIIESSLSMNVEADDESEVNELDIQSNEIENDTGVEDSNSDNNPNLENSELNEHLEDNEEHIDLNMNDENNDNENFIENEVEDENSNINLSIDKDTLEKMTLRELKAFASTNKIVQKGTKGELLDRVKTELNLN